MIFVCFPFEFPWKRVNKGMIDIDGAGLEIRVTIKCLFVCSRVLHANVMQSIMSHFNPPSCLPLTNGPLTDTYEFGNVISFSHNFAATFCFCSTYSNALTLDTRVQSLAGRLGRATGPGTWARLLGRAVGPGCWAGLLGRAAWPGC
jgi:hypothetical protein